MKKGGGLQFFIKNLNKLKNFPLRGGDKSSNPPGYTLGDETIILNII